MLGSSFFWRLYLTFAGLVLVTLAATGFLVHQQLRTTLLTDVESRLLVMATVLAPYSLEAFEEHGRRVGTDDARDTDDPTTQAEIKRLGDETDTRITLVAPDGRVIADSDRDPRTMNNHASRPEIVVSRTAPYGVSRRFSDTAQESLLYLAVTLNDDGREAGTVRTSIPLVEVDARLAALRNTIAVGAGLGMLIALAVGLVVARRITAPVAHMTEVAEALRAGDYGHRVDEHGTDEIGLLGSTLNRLADELTQRIATLAEQRAQLSAMIAGLQEGVFAVDESGGLIFHNQAADDMLGLAAEPHTAPILASIGVPDLVEMCTATRENSTPAQREIRIERDGTKYVLDVHTTAFEAGDEQGVVVVLHDITNLRRLEQMRTEFAANVSHELKTPLTSIRGYVETLIDGAIHDDANNVRFLGKIIEQTERLTALVSDVLSLARIEDVREGATDQVTDWRTVITRVIERYREDGALANHTCTTDLADAPVAIAADAESMTQVLDNLLDNAIKYTPTGGSITLRAAVREEVAVVEVEDTGIGVSEIDRERIFERFFRADRARSRDTGGTGLGLAIVKHLVQGVGGEVHVSSELGKGSCFAVHVPAAVLPPGTLDASRPEP